MWILSLILLTVAQESQGPQLPPPRIPGGATPSSATPSSDAVPSPRATGDADPVQVPLTSEAQAFLRALVLIVLPDDFENDKKWGEQKRVQSGLSVRLEDGRVRTHRKWKDVNHGRWQWHRIRLVDPEDRLRLAIENVSRRADGTYDFDVDCIARLQTEARWQDWRLGIPVLRVSADAVADIRLIARCEMKLTFDHSSFPPAVQLEPSVRRADLRLGRFEVRRISHVKGRIADQFSASIRQVLKSELARRREQIPRKINKQLAKKQDSLRVSLGEWLSFAEAVPAVDVSSDIAVPAGADGEDRREPPEPNQRSCGR